MSDVSGMNRREFLKLLGGGVLISVNLGPLSLFRAEGSPPVQQRGYPEDINAYLHIAEDGHVTLFSGKIEMGQGVMTSLSQMAAEDLGVSLESMDIVMGDTDRCPWDMGTWGSMTTRFFGPAVRAAAARARLVLTDLASETLGAPRDSLRVEDGIVFVESDPNRRVSYGALAKGQAITHTVDEEEVLRAVHEFKVIGESPLRMDGVEKVTGAAEFAGDIRLPGMLYARLLRPPAHGATMTRVDTSAAEAMPGVTVVNQDGMVAVLHSDPEMAGRALEAVVAEFDEPAATVDQESIFQHLVDTASEPNVPEREGDLEVGMRASAMTFDHTYYNAYVAHAPMEPHTALAEVRDGRVTVWSSTQSPFGTQSSLARALGLPPENIRVLTPFVGGGFGGKSAGQQAEEAARLAQITQCPVQVAWTRAEEFFYDTFRPAATLQVVSGIDGDGRITLWDYQVYGAGARGSDVFYDVPHHSVRVYGEWGGRGPSGMHPFAVGPWRAPAANSNRFAAEQQIEIMAMAAGIDPLEFRIRNTTDPRMVSVLKAVGDAAGWEPRVGPQGTNQGRGIACGIDAETYVANVAEVTVDPSTGAFKVDRVVCAQDMGVVVNPEGARMQMEGCIAMGLGYVLSEEIRFEGGKILDQNFGTYEIARFSQMPEIETVFVENDDLPPKGGGEPAIINMGGAVANAIFDATGVRVFHLPITPERVLEALRQK
ncbi:MAG: xanthine dehydrogenase family protein molybdopterin-binding subunit [Gemmatimonadetes bacterium]|nr:molybdopterin-dependent oxidoreductase [Gemmatimonadota bacterium]NNM05739.1 xanthine dehydrogenase family protein molybdopterin-binding subunit [Gemmatimonadota bacterium]